jgi:hypothetical protein
MRSAILAVSLLLFAASVGAQIPATEYAARRDSLAAHLGEGVVIAFGVREPVDDLANTRQLPGFAYLTGVPDPDAAFVMLLRAGKPERSVLLLPPKDPRIALYTGFLPSAEEVRQKYGLELRTMDGLRALVDSMTARKAIVWNLPDVATRDVLGQDSLTRGTAFQAQLRAGNALLTINSAQAALDSLRVRKARQKSPCCGARFRSRCRDTKPPFA